MSIPLERRSWRVGIFCWASYCKDNPSDVGSLTWRSRKSFNRMLISLLLIKVEWQRIPGEIQELRQNCFVLPESHKMSFPGFWLRTSEVRHIVGQWRLGLPHYTCSGSIYVVGISSANAKELVWIDAQNFPWMNFCYLPILNSLPKEV